MLIALPPELIEINRPSPVNIWDPEGELLLRKGEQVATERALERLLQSSPMVHDADFRALTYSYTTQLDRMVRDNQPLNRIAGLALPDHIEEGPESEDELNPVQAWPDLHTILSTLLHQGPASSHFVDRLAKVERKALRLLESSTDSSLFVLVQLLFDRRVSYSATHALLSAVVCHLVGPAAGIPAAEQPSLFRAALSMNIGMSRLHDELARQNLPPTPEQRALIAAHPHQGARLLRTLGVGDAQWLRLVEDHHEQLDGSGYPQGKSQLDLAQRLLSMADVFVARISPRAARRGMASGEVARDIFLNQNGQSDSLGAALIKTLGFYPPGSYVRLASTEVGVVVRRGRRANTPTVFAIIGRQGTPLGEPALRDTTDREYEIKSSLSADDVKVRVNAEKLLSRA